MPAERIVVGMSGGVDSSVAAALLARRATRSSASRCASGRGRRRTEASARFGSCCGTDAVEDARRVAGALGIPYYVLNMADEFDRKVIAPFADAYREGRTPVPCLACNCRPKVRLAPRPRRAPGTPPPSPPATTRASSAMPRPGRWLLLRARDLRKDQTDFLWPLTQAQLGAARFPIGDLTKDEVREYARRLGLVTADKPESQEICFVPDGTIAGSCASASPPTFRAGSIVDVDGRLLGRHEGVAGFTIGQRRGLGLAAGRAALRRRPRSRGRPGDGRRRGRPRARPAGGRPGQLHRRRAADRAAARRWPRSATTTSPRPPPLRAARGAGRGRLRSAPARDRPGPVVVWYQGEVGRWAAA